MRTTGKTTKLHKTVADCLERTGFLDRFLREDLILMCKVEPYDNMSDEEFDIVVKSDGRNVCLYKAINPSQPIKEGVTPAVMSREGFEKMASRKDLALSFLESQGVLRVNRE